MAIVKYVAPIDEMRGHLGGIVYSANGAGTYAKTWKMPAKPFSPPQSNQKAFLGSHGQYWNALTQAQRDDWDTYAAAAPQALTNSLGQTYYASGFNWYVRINNHLLSGAQSRRATYPTLSRPAAPAQNAPTYESPTLYGSYCALNHPSNTFLGYLAVCFIAFGPQGSALSPKNRWRLVYCAKGPYVTTEHMGIEVRALFGDIPIGWSAFFRVQRQDTHGQRSPITEKTHIVTVH